MGDWKVFENFQLYQFTKTLQCHCTAADFGMCGYDSELAVSKNHIPIF